MNPMGLDWSLDPPTPPHSGHIRLLINIFDSSRQKYTRDLLHFSQQDHKSLTLLFFIQGFAPSL